MQTRAKKYLGRGLALIVVAYFGLTALAVRAAVDQPYSEDDMVIQQRCWTKTQCEGTDATKGEVGGIWGKSTKETNGDSSYASRWGNGSVDKLSQDNCRTTGNTDTARCFKEPPNIPLQVGIPGVSTLYCSEYTLGETPPTCNAVGDACGKAGKCRPGVPGGFPGYLAAFFKFFVAALAVMAVVMVMWGGFKRIMAAGSSETIKGANDTIFGAISGLVLALLSYSLLSLINPQLVANAFPPLEIIKPDFWNYCPDPSAQPAYYTQGYVDLTGECTSNSTKAGESCSTNQDCPGGECNIPRGSTMENTVPSGDTCGKTLLINGRKCSGQACTSGGQGCFPKIPGEPKSGYKCSNYLMQGNLAGIEVNYIGLQIICNGTNPGAGHNCTISLPNGAQDSTIDVEGKTAYAIGDCVGGAGGTRLQPSVFCASSGGPKGYALILERESDSLGQFDDWYAIDASTCNDSITKAIHGSAPHKTDPTQTIHRIDWSAVPASKLFQENQILNTATDNYKHFTCDLNITDAEFINRPPI